MHHSIFTLPALYYAYINVCCIESYIIQKVKNNMNIHTIILSCAFLIALPCALTAGQQRPNVGAKMPEMTEAEMIKMQKEIDAQINEFVASLPPDQQAQFHKDVAELTEVMSKMSDDELVQFIETVLPPNETQQLPLPEVPKSSVPATPAKPPVQPKPTKPALSEKPKQKIEEAHALIEEIIGHIESFLRKSTLIPDLPGKGNGGFQKKN